jgi:YegS/Rv2252/BmrU family lipid kinase
MVKKDILFIINPNSGTGRQKGISELISEGLDTEQYNYVIRYTERQGHATEIAKKAIEHALDIVVAVGGDGTINEVARGLVGSGVALGIIPAGSGNGLARHLGISIKPAKAIEQLNSAEIGFMDTGLVNEQFFLNVSGVGFDATIAHKFDSAGTRGLWTYGKLIIKEWFGYKPRKYRLKSKELDVDFEAIFISFANGTQYGNDLRVAPLAMDDDGMVDLCVLEKFPRILTPLLIFYFMINRFYNFPYVRIYRAEGFELEVEKGTDLHLDGEPRNLGENLNISIVPASLKVMRFKK